MSNNKTIEEVGFANLNIDGEVIPNVRIFEIKGSYVFKGQEKNFHYYTTEQFNYQNETINAEYIRLYPYKTLNMTVEDDILPLFEGEIKNYQFKNKSSGEVFNRDLKFEPLKQPDYASSDKFVGSLEYV